MLFGVACVEEKIDASVEGNIVVLNAVVEQSDVKVGVLADSHSGKVSYAWTKGDQIAVQISDSEFSSFQLVAEGGTGNGVKSKFSTNNFKKIRIPQFSETRFGSFVGLFLCFDVYKQ